MKDKKLHILFIGDIMNEKGKSLWIDTVEFPSFSALNKDIKLISLLSVEEFVVFYVLII